MPGSVSTAACLQGAWQFAPSVCRAGLDRKISPNRNRRPTITLRDVLLRLGYSLMSRSTWSKTITVIGKSRVPPSLQNLHQRLLDESIQHGRNAELSHSSIRLRYLHPTDRLWLVGSTQQLFPNGWPVLFQVVGEF